VTTWVTVHAQTFDTATLDRAKAGDSSAQYEIGRAYQGGIGVEKNNEEATQWYRRSAASGNSSAQYALALELLYGWGGQRDVREGVSFLTKAAENDNVTAQMMLGQLYEDGGLGKYVSKDHSDFVDMVPKNDLLAAKWHRIAANNGNPLSQNHLGDMYLAGRGVPQNYAEAYFWLTLGDAGGVHSTTDGTDNRDVASSHLSKAMISAIQNRASEWFKHHPSMNSSGLPTHN
jgi:hypothetical protein